MSFIRSFSITFASKAFSLILLLICRILTARLLGPSDLGVYGSALNLATILSRWGSMGTVPATQLIISQNPLSKNQILTFILLASWVLGIANILIIYAFQEIIMTWQFPGSLAAFKLFKKLYLFLPVILLSMMLPIYLLGLSQYRNYALTQIIPLCVQVSIILSASEMSENNRIVVVAQLASWLTTVLISIVLIGFRNFHFEFSRSLFIKFTHLSIAMWPLIIIQFGLSRFAILIGSHSLSAVELGQYFLASNLSEAYFFIHASLAPIILNQSGADKPHINFLVRSLRFGNLLLIISLTITILIGRQPFLYFFGDDYAGSWKLFLLLIPNVLFHGMVSVFIHHLLARGKKQIALIFQLTSLVILVLSSFLLCPLYGASGLCVASFISSFCAWLCYLLKIKYDTNRMLSIGALWIPTSEDWNYLKNLRKVI